MDHRLIDGVRRLVGKDACGETRDDLLDARLVRGVENVVIDLDVYSL